VRAIVVVRYVLTAALRARVSACCIILLATALAATSRADEIEGMKLGMSFDQIRKIAASRGYAFTPVTDSGSGWTSYFLMKGASTGPSISLCRDTLSSILKTYKSNFHEFTSLIEKWSHSLGLPEIKSQQGYAEGVQFSSIDFRWNGEDNVRRSLSFSQYGTQQPDISYGFGYISHPCQRR
jgi:hypothetical protein